MRPAPSALLGLGAMALALLVGGGLGVMAALRQNKAQDYAVMALAIAGVCLPPLVVGPVMQLLFGVQLGWLPSQGLHTIACSDFASQKKEIRQNSSKVRRGAKLSLWNLFQMHLALQSHPWSKEASSLRFPALRAPRWSQGWCSHLVWIEQLAQIQATRRLRPGFRSRQHHSNSFPRPAE